jgi:hypothetical protein
MTLVVTDIERSEEERVVSVKTAPLGDREIHFGYETLIASRFLGTCSCGRVATAKVWRIANRYVPAKRARDPRFAGIAAQPFQDPGVLVPAAGSVLTSCPDCGKDVSLEMVRGKVKADHVCDVPLHERAREVVRVLVRWPEPRIGLGMSAVTPAVGSKWRSPVGGHVMQVVAVDETMVYVKRADESKRELANPAYGYPVARSEFNEWREIAS